MTTETAAFLLQVVNSITIQAGAPDFDKSVAAIQKARDELIQLLPDLVAADKEVEGVPA